MIGGIKKGANHEGASCNNNATVGTSRPGLWIQHIFILDIYFYFAAGHFLFTRFPVMMRVR